MRCTQWVIFEAPESITSLNVANPSFGQREICIGLSWKNSSMPPPAGEPKLVTPSASISHSGSIGSIFAEDGLIDTTISAYLRVDRILVGYQGGRRATIANEDADVSGSISAWYLGNLFYTGTLAEDMSLPDHHGPIHDDRP